MCWAGNSGRELVSFDVLTTDAASARHALVKHAVQQRTEGAMLHSYCSDHDICEAHLVSHASKVDLPCTY